MSIKTVLLAFALLLCSANCIRLIAHLDNQNSCYYFNFGKTISSNFQYEIIKPWTTDDISGLKSGSLRIQDYITITNSFEKLIQMNEFIERFFNNQELRFYYPEMNITKASDVPFNMTDDQLSYIAPSAELYKVSKFKVLTGIRFQIKDDTVGKWSVLYRTYPYDRQLFNKRKDSIISWFKRYTKDLTSGLIAKALNIKSSKIAKDLLDTFSQPPQQGEKGQISFQTYLIATPEGEEFVVGPIKKGQLKLFVMKDKLQERQPRG